MLLPDKENVQSVLYTDLAPLYTAIADDRDFEAECAELIKLYLQSHPLPKTNIRVLELFAGPAYHTASMERLTKAECYAIDISDAMKEIAVSKFPIDPTHYIVGELPAILDTFVEEKPFDIVVIMRYSLGLLSYEEAESLLERLTTLLNKGGVIFIELHALSLLMKNLDGLSIRERKKKIPNTDYSVTCRWPAGEIIWHDDSWLVEMPVEMEVTDLNEGNHVIHKTISKEYLFSSDELMRMAKRLNVFSTKLVPKNELNHCFIQSNLLVLRKIS